MALSKRAISQSLYDDFVRYTQYSSATHLSSCPRPLGGTRVLQVNLLVIPCSQRTWPMSIFRLTKSRRTRKASSLATTVVRRLSSPSVEVRTLLTLSSVCLLQIPLSLYQELTKDRYRPCIRPRSIRAYCRASFIRANGQGYPRTRRFPHCSQQRCTICCKCGLCASPCEPDIFHCHDGSLSGRCTRLAIRSYTQGQLPEHSHESVHFWSAPHG